MKMNPKQQRGLGSITIIIFLLSLSVSQAAAIYVDASSSTASPDGETWQTAFQYLQDALAISVYGDEIYVAQGIYRPDETYAKPEGTGQRNDVFALADGVALLGGYAGLNAADPDARDVAAYKTILSGDLDENDVAMTNPSQLVSDPTRSENSYRVISIINATSNLVLDGFVVTGGIAIGASPDSNGGGLRMTLSSPTINNCRFEYNAAANGGAVYCSTSNPVFTNCVFLRNYAQSTGGAIRNITSSSPALSNCTFIENKASGFGGAVGNYSNCSPAILQCIFSYNWANNGGAINNYDFCSPQITQSIFRHNATNNTGGAIRNENHSDSILINCRLYGNTAAHGACLYNYQSNPQMVNCIASGNTAVEYGGVLYNRDAIDISIINCTFVGNAAAIQGVSLYNILSSPSIQNCILWGNDNSGSTQIFTESGSPSVSHSCIQGGWASGTGNIDADPLFIASNGPDGMIGTADDDFRLYAESACVDSGNNTVVPADIFDLDNNGDVLERIPLDYNGQVRFVNVPDVIDAGIADLPEYPAVIDMGAIERKKPILVDLLAAGPEHDGTVWDKAFNHIQDALEIVEKSDIIWVAQGVYYPDRSHTHPAGSGNRSAAFALVDGVVLKGGYAGWTQADPDARDIETYPTVLSGDLGSNDAPVTDPAQMVNDLNRLDNSYHVITASDTRERTELNGFTIYGGHASGTLGTTNSFGAAMCNSNADVTISNCAFRGNWASVGGALYNYGTIADFAGCTFSRNAASDKGGIMRNTINSHTIFSDCTFTENSAGGFGGVISNNDHSPSMMTRCVFYDNAAASAAAVNNFIECHSTFTDCEFDSNHASGYGGAVNNYQQSNSQFIRCDFTANTASSGGAIYNDSSGPILRDCTFVDNTTTGSGGAIFSTNSPLTIETSTFLTNQSGNFGGALYHIAAGNLNLTHCAFTSNSAVRGGAIYCENSSPKVTDCSFFGNTTIDSGGAFYALSGNLSIEKGVFRNNQSGVNGGALCAVAAAELGLTNCVFSSNTAAYDGGGLSMENMTASKMANCLITYNSAQYGGGLANSGSNTANLVHCTLNQNTAQIGAGIYNSNAGAALKNSIVYDFIIPGNSVTVSYSCVLNGLGTGNGNINLNPSFVDPDGPDGIPGTEDDNFRLTSNSPCLDAADNTAIPTGLEMDLDSLFRIVDADCNGSLIADMGVYEFSYLPKGDFDLNCGINLLDFVELAETWLMRQGDPGYDARCDINFPKDQLIDAQDLSIFFENWLFIDLSPFIVPLNIGISSVN